MTTKKRTRMQCSACGSPAKDSWYPSDSPIKLTAYRNRINGIKLPLCDRCAKHADINGYKKEGNNMTYLDNRQWKSHAPKVTVEDV